MPCGATAQKVFTNAKITVTPVTHEPDVKSVLAKVELGEVDAGVVYVTDVRAAGSKVKGIAIDSSVNASTSYPIATLTHAPNPAGAQAFVDYVLSSAGQAVLTPDGFAAPVTGRGPRGPRPAAGRVPIALGRPGDSLRSLFLLLPLVALLVRAPWRGMPRILRDSQVLEALRLSLECASAATVLSFVFGVPLAWVLARSRLRGVAAAARAGHAAAGAAAGRRRRRAAARLRPATASSGRYLDQWFGITLPFTTPGVIVAETFVAMPFLIVTVEGALRAGDQDLEEAAATLGAGRMTTFRRVTLPVIAPSLLAGGGAVLGAGARRVRRDDHLRRQLPGDDADDAARGLPGPGDRPGGGDRAVPGAAGRLGRSSSSGCATAGCGPAMTPGPSTGPATGAAAPTVLV